MRCNNCNAEIADGSKFCPNCGAQFGAQPYGQQPYQQPYGQPYGQQQYPNNPYPAPGMQPPRRNNSVMIVTIIAVAVVVVIGIIAAIVIVGNNNKQEPTPQPNPKDTVVVYQNQTMPSTDGVASKQEREQMAGSGSVGRIKNVGFTGDFSDIACYTWLTDADVRGLSKSQLRVLRNTIYARHGRKFKSADLRQYFSQFSWYNPRYDEISPSALSKTEQHNISLIQKYE